MRHKKWTEGSRGLTNHAVSGLAWCLQHRGRCGLRSCQCGGTTANVEADVARAKKKKVIEIRRGTGEAREHRLMLRDLSDSDVVQASLDGDARAFGELTRRYDQRLLNFVYRTIGDRERGQDLVQETFVRVYRHLHRFEQAKKFSTWIYTIASNLAKNELRNRSRNPLVLFQTIKKNWDADHRPLEWEDTQNKAG